MSFSLPILTFHSLDDQRSAISFPPELFHRWMAYLFKNGYQTISLLTVVDHLGLTKPFPERSFVITFDDGYESVYKEAFPVLQNYGMTATIFLTIGKKGRPGSEERLPSLEGRPMLTWYEIKEMKQWGIEFGAHTLTHPDLTRLPLEGMRSEIIDSKRMIEDALSTPVMCFAAPYSRYDQRVLEIIRQHFTCACTDKLNLIQLDSDPYSLERVDTYYLRTERLFRLMMTPWFSWYLFVRAIPREFKRLIRNSSK